MDEIIAENGDGVNSEYAIAGACVTTLRSILRSWGTIFGAGKDWNSA
jgi:hypothetical protein